MLDNNTPKDYGLHHDEWRPNQLETINWIAQQKGYCVVEGSVGSGKTSFAAATAARYPVIALCRTKNLQQENYGNTYKFDVLFGKSNYECIHPEHHKEFADTCAYADTKGGMNSCPYSNECPYLVAKRNAMFSKKTSLNYPYWLTTSWPQAQNRPFVFMDEAHQLSDITIDWAGLSISQKVASKWRLPAFPNITSSEVSMFLQKETPAQRVLNWINESVIILDNTLSRKPTTVLNEKEIEEKRKCESLIRKLQATREAIEINPNDWYIKSGDNIVYDSGAMLPGIMCKPLTAKYHFKRYFGFGETLVMMSATIGEPSAFAEELGLSEYSYSRVANQWTAEQRPVIDLQAPRLGRSSSLADYEQHAKIIANAIKACPPDWSGVIHVTRKSESKLLAQRLTHLGLGHRVWTPNEKHGTNEQMEEWTRTKRNSNAGKIAIAWTWWEGVDLTEEKICIVAKAPFPYLGDEFEAQRMRYSSKTYMWRTATQLEQGLGRTRRGEPEDYDHNGVRNQLVAIADGNWTRVKNYISQDLLESIIKL